MLYALTLWAAISVRVNQDLPEMEEYVRVSKHKLFYSTQVLLILFSFTFFCKLIFRC